VIVAPQNDAIIVDSEALLRRLHPNWIVPGDRDRMRISSAAFKDEQLSVQFQSLLLQQGRPVADALKEHPDNSLCSVTAGLARDLGQAVVYDTQPPHDPAHGLVLGKKTKSIANRFAREARWVIPSAAPLISDRG
jgi:hypothetical protein